MSLSQASTKAEVQRDIKLQVFLAMSNKYSSGQTDRLIEDMEKVAKAITNTKTITTDVVADFVKAVQDKPMPERDKPASNDKPFLFIGGRHDGEVRRVAVNSEFRPVDEKIILLIPGTILPHAMRAEQCVTATSYFRHHLTVSTGRWSVARFFYCDEQDISHWTEKKLLSTLDRINKFFVDNMDDPMNNI